MRVFSIMGNFIRKQCTKIVLLLIPVYCIYYINENRWKGINGEEWRSVIAADGYGYYAYLPCIFILHKFDFGAIIKSEKDNRPGVPGIESAYTFPPYSPGVNIDKCFVGVALLITPFFLIAYFLSHILGYDTSGYSFLFAASVCIAALFYMIIGLIFVRKLLKIYAVPEYIICLVVIFAVFGTNLFDYVTMSQSLGHVYSFGINAVFLYYAKRSIDDKKLKYMVLMTIAIGIIIIIRPPNAMSVLMIPVLAGSWKKTVEFVVAIFSKFRFIVLFAVFTAVLFIQFTCWKIETGHFFVWSYPGEGFVFSEFHFIDILFSYRKGWFLYTPLMFIAIVGGLVALFRQNKFAFFTGLLYFTVVTYILSSWDGWWYGGSFSSRPFIDFYPGFLLFLGIFFASLRYIVTKVVIFIICCLCVGLNMQQTYQFEHFILPIDLMDKQKYWTIFLQSSNMYAGIFDYPDTTNLKPIDSLTYKNDFENTPAIPDKNITSDISHSCSHSYLINSVVQSTPFYIRDLSNLQSQKNLSVYAEFWAFMPDLDNDCKIIVNITDKDGNGVAWYFKSLKGFVFDKYKWTKAYFIFGMPEIKPGYKFRAFVNTSKGTVYVDDFILKFCTQ